MYKFGFIGTGNMGGALARGAAVCTPAKDILLANKDASAAETLAAELGCSTGTNLDVAKNCKYVILGVKPQIISSVISEIVPVLADRSDSFAVVSMAAGVSIGSIEAALGIECPVIRIMPNVAASVRESMILLSSNSLADEYTVNGFAEGMKGAGRIDEIDEGLIDAASALSGCGPAFVFMFAEALADGAVACGLPRAKAMEYAAQTILGSARLMLESGSHPGVLKDSVCSPGGTTIAGVGALEAGGFRAAAMKAVEAAYNRTLELGKK